MKARKIIALLLTLIITLGVCVALAACGGTEDPTPCTKHVDNNGDGVCDTEGCNEAVTPTPPPCTEHKDADGNGICDTEGCGETVAPVCTEHKDSDGDGICDTEGCGEAVEPVCTEHKDADGDGICDTEGCGETVEPEAPVYFNEEGELILYKNGTPTFQFVLGTDVGSAAGSVDTLAGILSPLGNSPVPVVRYDAEKTDVEIIFGSVTNRGDEYKFNKYSLGEDGYMVKQVGTKILVVGGSSTSLITAIDYLKTTVFGIKKNNDKFTDFVMESELNKEYFITDYRLTDVKIGDNSIRDYTLVYKSGDRTSKAVVTDMQKKLYSEAGIWLPTAAPKDGLPEDGELSIVFTIVEKNIDEYGEAGFEIYIDESGNLFIETQYENMLEKVFSGILYDEILATRGVYTFRERSIDVRNIYYSDFGVDITGSLNSIDGLIECHNYANQYGHIVNAVKPGESDVTIKITRTDGKYVSIATDVNWEGASFIIDDSWLTPNDNDDRNTHIFQIHSQNISRDYTPNPNAEAGTTEKLLADLTANGLSRETFNESLKFDIGLGRAALVFLYNENHKNYVRYGANQDSGATQMEFILIDENGNVDKDTPILYDFDEVTSIKVVYVDDESLTVKGGTVTTIANQLPRKYTYTYRGIGIYRSNTTIDGLAHYIEGEGDTGAPYAGFLTISNTNNVRVQNCILTGHKQYWLEGSEGINGMGTYDIGPSSSNNTYFYNVTQTNFLIDDPNNPGKQITSIGNGYWGIMGGNDCKNLTYDTCRLTRFDSHRGTTNGTIIDSDVAHVAVIGGGTLRIENSSIYMSSSGGSTLVSLRDDYGSTWNGEFIFKDVNVVMHHAFNGTSLNLVSAVWRVNEYASHDFGYDCYMPHTVTVDNLTCSSSKVKTVTLTNLGAVNNALTKNPYYVTERLIIRNNNAGFTFEKIFASAELIEE